MPEGGTWEHISQPLGAAGSFMEAPASGHLLSLSGHNVTGTLRVRCHCALKTRPFQSLQHGFLCEPQMQKQE